MLHSGHRKRKDRSRGPIPVKQRSDLLLEFSKLWRMVKLLETGAEPPHYESRAAWAAYLMRLQERREKELEFKHHEEVD